MSLTRKFLAEKGLDDNAIEEIIAKHIETVNGLRDKLDIANSYKEKAEKYEDAKKELDKLRGSDDYKAMYEKEHADFESYKKDIADKELFSKKKSVFSRIAKEDVKISDKRIEAIAKLENDFIKNIKLDKDGNAVDKSVIAKHLEDNYEDFIVKTSIQGAHTETPPANTGGKKKTLEEIKKITDTVERQQAYKDYYNERT